MIPAAQKGKARGTEGERKMGGKPVKLLTAALFGICAAIWTARCVPDLIYDPPGMLLRGLSILCAASWAAGFCKMVREYRRSRKQVLRPRRLCAGRQGSQKAAAGFFRRPCVGSKLNCGGLPTGI